MAVYQHSGWRQAGGPSEQLVEIDLFLTELTDLVTANVTKGASSRDVSSLNQLIAETEKSRARLVEIVARSSRGGLRRVRFM